MLSPTKLVEQLYSSYILFFILFLLIGSTMLAPLHNIALQLGMWIFGLLLSLYVLRNRRSSILPIVLVFQLFYCLVSSWINIVEYGDILGFDPHDAIFYRSCGEQFRDKSYISMLIWVANIFPTIDDWGFPSIMWLVYRVFGLQAAPWAIRVLNAVVIAWGSERLYKLSCRFLEKQESKFVALIWGLMPFAVHVSANGAKENFFVFFVISFFYYLYRFSEKKTVVALLKMILYCGLLFLFRLATGYVAILCIFILFFLKGRIIKKNFVFVFSVVAVLSVILFPILLDIIIQQRGYEIGFFGNRNEEKAEAVGGLIGFVVNTISSFIGPIPCFISSDTDKLQFLTKYSFTPYVKILISFFFYYAFADIFRNKRFKMIPMVVFSVINIILLIVAFFGLHVRMHWPHLPLFLIVAYWGYKKYTETKHMVSWYSIYLVFVFILIAFYNFR